MTLGPACLLRPPGGRGLGQLARHRQVRHHRGAPSLHHAAHGKIEILGQGIAGPAAAFFNRRARPHAGGAVEGDRQAGAEARFLLHREMGIQQKALYPRQPVGVAVGMAPARLDKGESRIGDQHRQGTAQEIARRHEVGIEDRDIRRIAMLEAERQIACLEAGAIAAAQNVELHAFGRYRHDALGQRGMIVAVAIVEKLDGETVPGPVHRGSGFGHPHGQQAFIADRQLHQDMRQRILAKRGVRPVWGFCGKRGPRPAPPTGPKGY